MAPEPETHEVLIFSTSRPEAVRDFAVEWGFTPRKSFQTEDDALHEYKGFPKNHAYWSPSLGGLIRSGAGEFFTLNFVDYEVFRSHGGDDSLHYLRAYHEKPRLLPNSVIIAEKTSLTHFYKTHRGQKNPAWVLYHALWLPCVLGTGKLPWRYTK